MPAYRYHHLGKPGGTPASLPREVRPPEAGPGPAGSSGTITLSVWQGACFLVGWMRIGLLCGCRRRSGLSGWRPRFYSMGLWVVWLAVGQLPLRADLPALFLVPPSTNPPAASATVRMGWSPSPSPNAAGSFLCWGFASGQCTNQLDAGSATNVTVAGFTTNTTYFFTVVAYDDVGDRAAPSNEVQYSVPGAAAAPALRLNLQPASPSSPGVVCLSFQGSAGTPYTILATQDFLQWEAVWNTNCMADGPVVFSAADMANYPQRFYRLVQQ